MGASENDPMRCPTVVGVPCQEMPFWMLKVGINDDQSIEIRKRDQAVVLLLNAYRGRIFLVYDGCTYLLVPCGRSNLLQLEACCN